MNRKMNKTASILLIGLAGLMFSIPGLAQSRNKKPTQAPTRLEFQVLHLEGKTILLKFNKSVNESYAGYACGGSTKYDPAAMKALCADKRITYVAVREADKVQFTVCDLCNEDEVLRSSAIPRLSALRAFRGMTEVAKIRPRP